MVRETSVSLNAFIYPLFLIDGKAKKIAIDSMPGIFRWSEDMVLHEIESCLELGITNFALFPAFEESLKDSRATISAEEQNFYLRAIRAIKSRFPEVILLSDVAMDPYSSDGHDGLVIDGKIDNDLTIPILCKMAVAQAHAGVDIVGPSDMMDGRIGAIRSSLDQAGFTEVSIMSYCAKYASSFYGPFRDALDSAPKMGDKKSYQMDPANRKEARIEAALDMEEGADFIMVKPALSYLDVIHDLSSTFDIPVAAYNVSGEYSMIKAAAARGWIDEGKAMEEVITSIRRAGASVVLTYFAKEFAERAKS
jgi:porphobilinogen synthase